MKKIKGVLVLVTLLVLLVGAVNASEVSDDTTTSTIKEVQETNTVSHTDTLSQENKCGGTIRTDKSQENSMNENKTLNRNANIKEEAKDETVRGIVKNKEKNTKTASSYDVKTYQELRDALTNINEEYTTVNIKDNIKLEGNILVNSTDVASHNYVTINGEGKTIDGDHKHYFLNIHSPLLEVTINNLTINNCTAAPSLVDGSQLTAGGAIRNYATLILNNTQFNNNKAELYGGAIWNFNNLIVDNTEFNNNTLHSDNNASGIMLGGAIYNEESGATAIVNNTQFNNNHAKFGGAIYSDSGYLTVDNTQFNNNHADNAGGAIFTGGAGVGSQYPSPIASSSPSATLTVTNTQFNNNTADREGGAISNSGNLSVNNTQFNNNNAYGLYTDYDEIIGGYIMVGGYGGAISHGGCGTLTVDNTQFNNNYADNYGGAISSDSALCVTNTRFNNNIANRWGGAIYRSNGTYNITDTTFNKNTPANFIINQDNYIDLEDNCNYINVGNLAIIVDGEERYNGKLYLDTTLIAFCDIPEGNHLVKLVVNGSNITNNEYILSDTIDVTNQNLIDTIEKATSDITIKLKDGLSYNITETITVDKPGITITIDGNGQSINGMQKQAFHINSGSSLVLKNITITNAKAIRGGAIYNDGNLTITGSTLNNNTATGDDDIAFGGAIFNNGTLTITDSILINNTATVATTGEFEQVYAWGGAIYNIYGRVTVTNTTFTNNKATATASGTGEYAIAKAYGGAISNNLGILTITDTTLNNNTAMATASGDWNVEAHAGGGAIHNSKTLTITDSTLNNNQATATASGESANTIDYASGGAISNDRTDSYMITGTSFYNNTQANFIINETTKKIKLINEEYISIGKFSIIADGIEIGTGTGEDALAHFTIADEYKNVELVINGTDEKTINNRYILRGSIVEIHNYTELTEAIQKAQSENYDSLLIYLMPGDYNATGNITWEESETKKLIINGNGITLDGKHEHQFIRIGSELNLILINVTLTNFIADNGGAIHNLGHLTIINSSFAANNATNYGGAIYSQNILNITGSNFIQNNASNGAAINFNGNTINLINNVFTQNTASADGETLNLAGSLTLEDNIYNSTDIAFKTVNLRVKDNKQHYYPGEDVVLNFTIELEHPESYDEHIQEKLDKTLYINSIENVTTKYNNYTLSNLGFGEYSIIYTLNKNMSNTETFKVMAVSEITTPEKEYDYYEGIKNSVTLEINNPSGEKGTVDISVKKGDKYQKLLNYHNVKDGYTFTTETLKEALENLYDNLDQSYIINITYTSNCAAPSSTEFTLNIIQKRNTSIIYDIINNTEGNVQINITLTDTVSKTPINSATIKITGDITQTTTSGIITDTTLSPGSYTINVLYDETESYKSSEATINFNVEIDKDKKIEELEEQVEKLNNTIKEQTGTINTLNTTVNNLTAQLNNANKKINTLNNTVQKLTRQLEDANNKIDKLTQEIEKLTDKTKQNTTITINPIQSSVGSIVEISANIKDQNGKAVDDGRVIFNINGKTLRDEYNNIIYALVSNGTAIINYKVKEAWLKNTTTIQATYSGSQKYASSKVNSSTTLKISKGKATLILDEKNITAKAGETITLRAKVLDSNGDRINSSQVIFKLNGKTLTDKNGKQLKAKVIDGDAVLKYTIPANYSAKTYNLSAAYGGSYEHTETTGKLTIEQKAVTINTPSITTNNKKTHLKATITDENGLLLAGTTKLAIKINGKTVLNNVTSNNGKINVSFITSLKEGIYELLIISGENNLYQSGRLTTVLKLNLPIL